MPRHRDRRRGQRDFEPQPELLNGDPYGAGWICRIEISDPRELDAFMDADAYRALTEG